MLHLKLCSFITSLLLLLCLLSTDQFFFQSVMYTIEFIIIVFDLIILSLNLMLLFSPSLQGKIVYICFYLTLWLIYRNFDLLMVLVSSISDFFFSFSMSLLNSFFHIFNVSLISFNCFSSCFQPGTYFFDFFEYTFYV